MTVAAAFQGDLMADLSLFQLVPIQIEMDTAAQGFELLQFLSTNQFRSRLMDRIGLGLGGGHVHEFPNKFLVEIQRCTHGQFFFVMPISYA
jgi:hypothetical protein